MRHLSLLLLPGHLIILIIGLFSLSNGAVAWALCGLVSASVAYYVTLPPYIPPKHPEL